MRPLLAVLLAAVCFGTTGTAQAFGPEGASALSIGAARILIGGALLGVIALVLQRRLRMRSTRLDVPATHGSPTRRLPVPVLVAIGALGILAYQPAFFAGTSSNGVAVGTVVALGSAPILTGVLGGILTRRFPGTLWLLATVVCSVGVVLISGLVGSGQADAAGVIDPLGLLASVGAGASYAVYTLAGKALLTRGWSSAGTMGVLFGTAAVLSVPLLLSTDIRWLATLPGLAMAIWLGVVTTAVAYLLFGWGLARLPAATVSTLTLAEPLTATLLGVLVLGEALPPLAVAGLVVLAAGLVILGADRPRRPVASPGHEDALPAAS